MSMIALVGIVFSMGKGFSQSSGRVANFSYGTTDSPDFESYSFWVRSNQKSDIGYTYTSKTGTTKKLKLKYAGVSPWNGQQAFKIKFPNGLLLYAIPSNGETLKIVSLDGTYSKIFQWQYEGPVNGIGTWCEPCAQDGKDAVKILKTYYLR